MTVNLSQICHLIRLGIFPKPMQSKAIETLALYSSNCGPWTSSLWTDKNGKWKEVFRKFYSNLTLLWHFTVFYKIIGPQWIWWETLILHYRVFEKHCANLNVPKSLWPLVINEITLAHWLLTGSSSLNIHTGPSLPTLSTQPAHLGAPLETATICFRANLSPRHPQMDTPSITCSHCQARTISVLPSLAGAPFLCSEPSWVSLAWHCLLSLEIS